MDDALTLAGAGFTYRDAEAPALSEVDLRVRPGEMLAVLGPQGSGTSTLCRLAAGLLDEHGTVTGLISGPHPPGSAASDDHSRDDLGPSDDHLVPRNRNWSGAGGRAAGVVMLGDDPEAQQTGMTSFVRDEVRLPNRFQGLDAETSAQYADDALASLGVTHLRDRRLDSLSGGERQLVALAGLMTLRPTLLVLDQPGLSLDAAARQHLLHALRTYCSGGGAVLLAGHQHDELSAACGRVAFLQDGQVTEETGSGPERSSPAESGPGQLGPAPETLAEHGIWNTLPTGSGPRQMCQNYGKAPASEGHSRSSDTLTVLSCDALTVQDSDALTVQGLRVERGGSVILDDAGLRLGHGEIVTLLGANGSGKSTLLRALAGLLEKDAHVTGSIRAGNVSLEDLPAHHRAGIVAWVGQDPGAQLSASTVRAELEQSVPLPRHRRRDRDRMRAERAGVVAEILERTGLAGVAQEHPYDLSPARRKDLVIATALLLRPRVLLLDEPTLGRDRAGMEQLTALLRSVADEGGTALVTTHDHAWAGAVSHRRLHLEQGSLTEHHIAHHRVAGTPPHEERTT